MTANDTPKQLGQMLVERGLLSEEQLASALREHRAMPKALGLRRPAPSCPPAAWSPPSVGPGRWRVR